MTGKRFALLSQEGGAIRRIAREVPEDRYIVQLSTARQPEEEMGSVSV